MSIDEIWNDEDPLERKAKQEADQKQAEAQDPALHAASAEEEITFDHEDSAQAPSESAFASPEPETEIEPTVVDPQSSDPAPSSAVSTSAADSGVNDFENIGSEVIEDDDAFGDEGFDELDELEAEIARELED